MKDSAVYQVGEEASLPIKVAGNTNVGHVFFILLLLLLFFFLKVQVKLVIC